MTCWSAKRFLSVLVTKWIHLSKFVIGHRRRHFAIRPYTLIFEMQNVNANMPTNTLHDRTWSRDQDILLQCCHHHVVCPDAILRLSDVPSLLIASHGALDDSLPDRFHQTLLGVIGRLLVGLSIRIDSSTDTADSVIQLEFGLSQRKDLLLSERDRARRVAVSSGEKHGSIPG